MGNQPLGTRAPFTPAHAAPRAMVMATTTLVAGATTSEGYSASPAALVTSTELPPRVRNLWGLRVERRSSDPPQEDRGERPASEH